MIRFDLLEAVVIENFTSKCYYLSFSTGLADPFKFGLYVYIKLVAVFCQ